MILVISADNTHITLGGVEGKKLVFSSRLASDRSKTADEYALAFGGILRMYGVSPEDIDGGILSCVVPSLRKILPQAVRTLTGIDIMVVGSGIRTGLNILTENPATLGSDLVVNAVAALEIYSPPLAIIDMDTAVTLSVIDGKGNYIGGAILPGVRISVEALADRADQLPSIELAAPRRLIGTNTVECMQAGAFHGYACMADGLVGRVEDELGTPVTAVLTGDFAKEIAPFCKRELHLEPHLQVEGLRLLYEKNLKKGPKGKV